jgi:hypothetical protein
MDLIIYYLDAGVRLWSFREAQVALLSGSYRESQPSESEVKRRLSGLVWIWGADVCFRNSGGY